MFVYEKYNKNYTRFADSFRFPVIATFFYDQCKFFHFDMPWINLIVAIQLLKSEWNKSIYTLRKNIRSFSVEFFGRQ